MLCLYNSIYGLSGLGVTEEQLAKDVIGSSVDALRQQTANFNHLRGLGGLGRNSTDSSSVGNKGQENIFYSEFKDLPKETLRSFCVDIINQRLSNPDDRTKKVQLGFNIDKARKEVQRQRKAAFEKKGLDINKYKFGGVRPKDQPITDDDETPSTPIDSGNIPTSETKPKNTPKDDIMDFLKSVYEELKNGVENVDVEKLKDNIMFAIDIVGSDLTNKESINENKKMTKKIIKLTEQQLRFVINNLVEQTADLDELTHDEFKHSERLQSLRDAINKNKIIGVAYVKQDGSVRAMCFKKYLGSYISSERTKSEKQQGMNETHNQISVVDLNIYNKALRENGDDKAAAAKICWRKINLESVLGFIAGGNFIDLRGPEDNDILAKYGEEVYNSLTKSMVNIIDRNAQENAADVQEPQAQGNLEGNNGGGLEIPAE